MKSMLIFAANYNIVVHCAPEIGNFKFRKKSHNNITYLRHFRIGDEYIY